jgi:transcription antitermination factor NusG
MHGNDLWFALYVKPRHEKVVDESVKSKGYTSFLPTFRNRHRSGGRIQEVDLPLFPGYLFCRFDPVDRLPLLKIPGVFQVVSFGGKPMPIEDIQLERLRIVARSGSGRPWPYLPSGTRVRIAQGALQGLEGILISSKGTNRLVVSIDMMQRSVAVEIDRNLAKPC